MAILRSKDGKELMVNCSCGCDEGMKIKVEKDDYDCDLYYLSYTSGNFYRDQDETLWLIFRKKLKKIWCIIRNKDYYYSEICMTKDDFNEFKEYLNAIH